MSTKIMIFGAIVTGIIAVTVAAAEPIAAAVGAIATPGFVGLGLALAVAVAVGLAWFAWDRYEHAATRRAQRRLAEAEADKAAAEARKARRDSDIYTVTHKADEVLHVYDTQEGYWRNAALDPRLYANGPESAPPSPGELATWAAWQQLHATAKRPQLAAPVGEQPQLEAMRPILPILAEAQRAMIAGPSGTGKTTLLQHLVNGR